MHRQFTALLILVAACNPIFGPDEHREVGIIRGLASDAPAIEGPAQVDAGAEFTVTIVTGWRDGCARKGTVESASLAGAVMLTPYDVIRDGGVCTMAVQEFTHSATLRFTEPGTSTIVVRGRAETGGEVLAIERELTVR